MRKKAAPNAATRRTISFIDGMTDEEREARERQEEQDARAPGRPYSRKDVARRARLLAEKPPGWIAEDVKLEPAIDGDHAVLVSVGPSIAGVVDKYACVYMSSLQLEKLRGLLNDRVARRDHPSEPGQAREKACLPQMASDVPMVEKDL